jgi:hypothetical protein
VTPTAGCTRPVKGGYSIRLRAGHEPDQDGAGRDYSFISYAQIDWGGLMAAAVLITLPVLVLAVVTQRYVIRGLTAGAVKS